MVRTWTLAPAPMVDRDAIWDFAQSAEAQGWDGVMFPDNQSLWGDTYVSMTIAAEATSSLQLGHASTNAGTRHPAVTASAVAAVDRISGGRASLGIARGDSALAHVGSAPVSVAHFEKYVSVVRRLLHGETVPFDACDTWRPSAAAASLPLSDAPDGTKLHFLEQQSSTPITIYASGPKTMEVAGRHADVALFGLGASAERIAWGMDVVRRAAEEYGRDSSAVRFGALMSIAVSDDREAARRLVANIVASAARFSSLHGRVSGPVSTADRSVYESVAQTYNMRAHGETSSQVRALNDEFIDAFAVVGEVDHCVDRLRELVSLGLDELLLIVPRNDQASVGAESATAVVEAVLPRLKQAAVV
ncbi:LLM class flavin-dependent oxidoreductase [Nocardioides humi]|uniref:5,10-methylenetetrahydromethanopterin reductase n=1 Tax=Nocardioides humi TaxID=449461 RepID=A0ABN2B422_9ACTN|nr:LLM class flavin-dependent oxidoreductase [Nocardioides humi]